jgi:hypothetical protein
MKAACYCERAGFLLSGMVLVMVLSSPEDMLKRLMILVWYGSGDDVICR